MYPNLKLVLLKVVISDYLISFRDNIISKHVPTTL